MTLQEFNTLDAKEQHEAVWAGTCMGFRKEGEYKIIIYKVGDFYAEIFYIKEDNEIKKLTAIPALKTELIPSINPSTLYE